MNSAAKLTHQKRENSDEREMNLTISGPEVLGAVEQEQ